MKTPLYKIIENEENTLELLFKSNNLLISKLRKSVNLLENLFNTIMFFVFLSLIISIFSYLSLIPFFILTLLNIIIFNFIKLFNKRLNSLLDNSNQYKFLKSSLYIIQR
jgi:ABC-type bacteriocin/lantibiotic exporter with double-glycine peptidase domain